MRGRAAGPRVDDTPDWDQAACLGMDPDIFFPERGEDVTRAKAVCAECPIKRECLQYAMDNYERHGLWGGRSERERRQMRRIWRFQ